MRFNFEFAKLKKLFEEYKKHYRVRYFSPKDGSRSMEDITFPVLLSLTRKWFDFETKNLFELFLKYLLLLPLLLILTGALFFFLLLGTIIWNILSFFVFWVFLFYLLTSAIQFRER
jgi:hypothetical protein